MAANRIPSDVWVKILEYVIDDGFGASVWEWILALDGPIMCKTWHAATKKTSLLTKVFTVLLDSPKHKYLKCGTRIQVIAQQIRCYRSLRSPFRLSLVSLIAHLRLRGVAVPYAWMFEEWLEGWNKRFMANEELCPMEWVRLTQHDIETMKRQIEYLKNPPLKVYWDDLEIESICGATANAVTLFDALADGVKHAIGIETTTSAFVHGINYGCMSCAGETINKPIEEFIAFRSWLTENKKTKTALMLCSHCFLQVQTLWTRQQLRPTKKVAKVELPLIICDDFICLGEEVIRRDTIEVPLIEIQCQTECMELVEDGELNLTSVALQCMLNNITNDLLFRDFVEWLQRFQEKPNNNENKEDYIEILDDTSSSFSSLEDDDDQSMASEEE